MQSGALGLSANTQKHREKLFNILASGNNIYFMELDQASNSMGIYYCHCIKYPSCCFIIFRGFTLCGEKLVARDKPKWQF